MQKGKWLLKIIMACTMVCVFTISLVLIPVGNVCLAVEETGNDYLIKARAEAEKQRRAAERALAEAEAAIEEAEAAIEDAEATKHKAKKEKVQALQEMVSSGYFPDDIEMTDAAGTSRAIFSHSKHTKREKLKCIECHPRVFIMKVGKNVVKKGSLTMAEMKKGKYCGNCHNGHKAFSVSAVKSCKKCHPSN